MAGITFERCEPDVLKKIFVERMTRQFKRMRSKIVKVTDSYYFKEMRGEELS